MSCTHVLGREAPGPGIGPVPGDGLRGDASVRRGLGGAVAGLGTDLLGFEASRSCAAVALLSSSENNQTPRKPTIIEKAAGEV